MKWNSMKLPQRHYGFVDFLGDTGVSLVDEEIEIMAETKNKERVKMRTISNGLSTKTIDEVIEIMDEIKKISREIHVGLIRSDESIDQPSVSRKLEGLTPFPQMEARLKKAIGPPYDKNTKVVFLPSGYRPPASGENRRLPPNVAAKIVACENGNVVLFVFEAVPPGNIIRLGKRVRKFLKGIPFSDESVNKEEPP